MKLHQLQPPVTKQARRRGRGIGSGRGKTAGRGTKGQKARSGGSIPTHFEGGRNALIHRLPKQRGFKSLRPKAQTVKTSQLAKLKSAEITAANLKVAGLIKSQHLPVKLVFDAPVKKPYKLAVPASKNAIAALSKPFAAKAPVAKTRPARS